jgi:hypothetical protein
VSLSEKHIPVNAAADLRVVYGPNAAKKIARKFGIAVVTAKVWLSGRTPTARQGEIAAALLAECDRLEALIAETRKRWATGATSVETTGFVAGQRPDRTGQTPGRVRR